MKFITFSGVDGSGKSTQLAFLKEKLERENWNVAYFHAVEFSVVSRLKKQLTANKKQESEKAVTQASWLAIFFRKVFLFVDLIRFRFFIARLKRENCDYLLSDRYFFDTIINIEYLKTINNQQSVANEKKSSSMLSIICYLLVVSDIAFYFDVAPGVIMSRERAPEQGIEYLRAKQTLFKKKITGWNMIVIDANRDKESILQDIIKKICPVVEL